MRTWVLGVAVAALTGALPSGGVAAVVIDVLAAKGNVPLSFVAVGKGIKSVNGKALAATQSDTLRLRTPVELAVALELGPLVLDSGSNDVWLAVTATFGKNEINATAARLLVEQGSDGVTVQGVPRP